MGAKISLEVNKRTTFLNFFKPATVLLFSVFSSKKYQALKLFVIKKSLVFQVGTTPGSRQSDDNYTKQKQSVYYLSDNPVTKTLTPGQLF